MCVGATGISQTDDCMLETAPRRLCLCEDKQQLIMKRVWSSFSHVHNHPRKGIMPERAFTAHMDSSPHQQDIRKLGAG